MVEEGEFKALFVSIWRPRKLNAMIKSIKQVWVRHVVAFENGEF